MCFILFVREWLKKYVPVRLVFCFITMQALDKCAFTPFGMPICSYTLPCCGELHNYKEQKQCGKGQVSKLCFIFFVRCSTQFPNKKGGICTATVVSVGTAHVGTRYGSSMTATC